MLIKITPNGIQYEHGASCCHLSLSKAKCWHFDNFVTIHSYQFSVLYMLIKILPMEVDMHMVPTGTSDSLFAAKF